MTKKFKAVSKYLSHISLKLNRTCSFILILLISLFVLSFCPIQSKSEIIDRIVAIVNDDIITLSELNEAVELYLKQRPESYASIKNNQEALFKVRNEVLNGLIDQKLAQQEVEKKGIKVKDEEVNDAIERIKSKYFLTEEDLKKILEHNGLTLEQYREQTRKQLLQIKLINLEVKSKIVITDQEIRDYYERHKDEYGGNTKYHLLGILFKVPLNDKKIDEKNTIQRKVEHIVQELRSGASFEEIIRKYSNSKIPIEGGDLGFFTLDELSDTLKKVVQVMKEGEISPLLKTPQGYQIVKLQKIVTNPTKNLKDVRMEIHNKLFQEALDKKYKAWLKGLKERSYIKIIQ